MSSELNPDDFSSTYDMSYLLLQIMTVMETKWALKGSDTKKPKYYTNLL